MKKSIAVVGGDERQVYLARLLREDGADVITWGLEKGNGLFSVPLDRISEAEIVVLPLPVCRENMLNLPLTDTVLPIDALWKILSREQIIFGGMIGALKQEADRNYSLDLLDYYDREEVQIANAVPTAEGAILRAMQETTYTLHGSSCLVVGYGRIGKLLAQRLHCLGAKVTVAARKRSDLAWINAQGYTSLHTNQLLGRLGQFDLIFNTAPAIVVDEKCLKSVKKDCILFELASLPGGIDAKAVKEYGLRMIVERGLPAKIAPLSAARAIRDGIYHILKERGVSK